MSAITIVVWTPTKIIYAVLGLTVGGFGYVLSEGDSNVAKGVINPACKGTYVITPSILKGNEHFVPAGK